jgi:hypothetical protein
MLICQTNHYVVEIPKAGSSTLQVVLDRTVNGTTLNGHHSVSEAIRRNKGQEFSGITAVVRRPEDRLVSACNHLLSNLNLHPEDRPGALRAAADLIAGALDGYDRKTHLVHYFCFKPQHAFLDTDHTVTLYRFEALERAARALGYVGDLPHANKSIRWVSHEDVAALDGYAPLIQRYAQDAALWREALGP